MCRRLILMALPRLHGVFGMMDGVGIPSPLA